MKVNGIQNTGLHFTFTGYNWILYGQNNADKLFCLKILPSESKSYRFGMAWGWLNYDNVHFLEKKLPNRCTCNKCCYKSIWLHTNREDLSDCLPQNQRICQNKSCSLFKHCQNHSSMAFSTHEQISRSIKMKDKAFQSSHPVVWFPEAMETENVNKPNDKQHNQLGDISCIMTM